MYRRRKVPRDFPACFGAPNRKVDGFIGNLTQQSEGVRVAQTPLLGLRLVSFARASSLLRSDAGLALRW